MKEGKSEMSEFRTEKSEMSVVEFTSSALQRQVAPPSVGSVKARIAYAARKLGWSFSRTKDAWYADPRISISAIELRAIEETAGVRYGREQLNEVDRLIARSTALLQGQDEDFTGAFAAALRAFYGALDRSRASRRE